MVSWRERRILASIIVVAIVLRLVLLFVFDDAAGDGPTRAAMGWHWYESGRVSFQGNWLPGHEILIGALLHLWPEPAWAGRIVSFVTGVLCVPLLYELTRGLFGPRAALTAAALLATNPLHGALSATSLSEAPAVLALLTILVMAFRLTRRPGDPVTWMALALAGFVGASIRFEFWLVLPVIALHHLLATRSLVRAALVTAATGFFPALWFLQRLEAGGLARAYEGALSGAAFVGADPVGAVTAVSILGHTLRSVAGIPVLAAGLIGIVAAAGLLTGPRRFDRLAFLGLVAGETVFLWRFTVDRGAALWWRYLATETVLLLPLAGLALARCLEPGAVRAAATAGALLGAPIAASTERPESFYLTREIPDATRATAAWLERTVPADASLIITRMGWQSSYLPVLVPLGPTRYRIVSDWVSDTELRAFARDQGPGWLITRLDDRTLAERLARATGLVPIPPPEVRFGDILVFRLEPTRPL